MQLDKIRAILAESIAAIEGRRCDVLSEMVSNDIEEDDDEEEVDEGCKDDIDEVAEKPVVSAVREQADEPLISAEAEGFLTYLSELTARAFESAGVEIEDEGEALDITLDVAGQMIDAGLLPQVPDVELASPEEFGAWVTAAESARLADEVSTVLGASLSEGVIPEPLKNHIKYLVRANDNKKQNRDTKIGKGDFEMPPKSVGILKKYGLLDTFGKYDEDWCAPTEKGKKWADDYEASMLESVLGERKGGAYERSDHAGSEATYAKDDRKHFNSKAGGQKYVKKLASRSMRRSADREIDDRLADDDEKDESVE